MIFWLVLNLLSLFCLSFYSATEMACVSLNKVRLHYYKESGEQRAVWLTYLLDHPFRLFGTTLIGVNVAMCVGSESARQFYEAIGLNPNFAPITQVAIVLIFGDLAPMFAARHYAEHVAMLGAPVLYYSAQIMRPILLVIGAVVRTLNSIVGIRQTPREIFLTQEELKKVLEEHREEGQESVTAISSNILELRNKFPGEVSFPLDQHPLLPSSATVFQMKNLLQKVDAQFVPLYHKNHKNIVGIAFPRDLVRIGNHKRVREFAKPPWFVTETTPMTSILKQFQRNRQSVCVILNSRGEAQGLLTLDQLLTLIFGKPSPDSGQRDMVVIDRSFPAQTTICEIEENFNLAISNHSQLTLSELFKRHLSHPPQKGDAIQIGNFEMTITETTLLEIKTIHVKNRT